MNAITVRSRKPRRAGIWFAVVVTAGLTGTSLVFLALREPVYQLRFEQTEKDPIELRAALTFANELERLQGWVPDAASPTAAAAAAAHVRHWANAHVETWEGLKRSGDLPGISTLNACLDLLAGRLGDDRLVELRQLSEDELTRRLQRELQGAIEGQRETAILGLLAAPEFDPLLARITEPARSRRPRFLRLWIASAVGTPLRDEQLWREAAIRDALAAKKRLAQVSLMYSRIDGTTETSLDVTGTNRLIARRMTYLDPLCDPVRYASEQSTADWAVLLQSPAPGAESAKACIEEDTGLRLHELRLHAKGDGTVQPGWPPAFCVVEEQKFARFLRARGIPSGWRLSSLRAEPAGSRQHPSIRVGYTLRADEFPEWTHSGTLTVATGDPNAIAGQIGQGVHDAKAALSRYILGASRYRTLPARFSVSDGPDDFQMSLELPGGHMATLRAILTPEGRMACTGFASLRDGEAFADWVAGRCPVLQRVRPLLAASGMTVDLDGRIGGKFAVQVPAGAHPVPNLVWRMLSDGSVVVDTPADWEATAARLSADVPSVKVDDPPAIIEQALSRALSAQLPGLGSTLTVARAGADNRWCVGIRIADWPEIRVGPETIHTLAEVQAAAACLASAERVKKAADERWRQTDDEPDATWQHPRFGRVAATLTEWSPQTGVAVVRCDTHLLKRRPPGERISIHWEDRLRLSNGTWTYLSNSEIAEQVVPLLRDTGPFLTQLFYLAEAERFRLKNPIPTVKWVSARMEPDITAGGADGWLTLNPLTARFRVSIGIRFNWMPDAVKGITFGRTLIVGEDDRSFQGGGDCVLMSSVHCWPYFSVSDPRLGIQYDGDRMVVSLGCKLTPPCLSLEAAETFADSFPEMLQPGLRKDNPWLHIVYAGGQGFLRTTDPQFGLKGNLRFFNAADLAKGDFIVSVATPNQPGQIEGHVEAHSPVIGSIPHLVKMNGHFLIDGSGATTEGRVDLHRVASAHGLFQFATGEKPHVNVAANVRVPLIGGRVKFDGESDLWFERYSLTSVVDVLRSSLFPRRVICRMRITPKGFEAELMTVENGKTYVHRVAGPTVDDVDPRVAVGELEQLVRQGGAGTGVPEPTREEQEYFGKLADTQIKPYTGPRSPGMELVETEFKQPVIHEAAKQKADPSYRLITKLDIDDRPPVASKSDLNNLPRGGPPAIQFLIAHPKDGTFRDALIINKAQAGLGHIRSVKHDEHGCDFTVWLRADWQDAMNRAGAFDVSEGQVLVFDDKRKETRLIRIKGQSKIDVAENWTDRFAAWAPLFGTGEEADRAHVELAQIAIVDYAEANTHPGWKFKGSRDGSQAGLAYEWETADVPPRNSAAFFWHSEGISCGARIIGPLVRPEQRTEAFYAALARSAPKDRRAYVVAVEDGADGRIALVKREGAKRVLVVDAGPPIEITPTTDFTGTVYAAANRAASFLWSRKLDAESVKGLFVGTMGAVLEVDSGLWLFPSGAAFTRAPAKPAYFLRWDLLHAWNRESIDDLPKWLRDRPGRASLNAREVANEFLWNWESARNMPVDAPNGAQALARARNWGADPLGLLIGLAEQKEDARDAN